MMAEPGPDPQSETVHAPHRDEAPPKRTKQPLVWITVALLILAVLAGLLIWAAVRTA
jgi:hypothetical protein